MAVMFGSRPHGLGEPSNLWSLTVKRFVSVLMVLAAPMVLACGQSSTATPGETSRPATSADAAAAVDDSVGAALEALFTKKLAVGDVVTVTAKIGAMPTYPFRIGMTSDSTSAGSARVIVSCRTVAGREVASFPKTASDGTSNLHLMGTSMTVRGALQLLAVDPLTLQLKRCSRVEPSR